MNFSPFVMFNGDCEQAFGHYHSVFGGELEMLRYSDAPLLDKPEAQMDNKIMYAQLQTHNQKLMGCDASDAMYQPQQGVLVAWQGETEAEVERVFVALAQGGMVRQALNYAFWTPKYGLVEDQFGILWMISCQKSDA